MKKIYFLTILLVMSLFAVSGVLAANGITGQVTGSSVESTCQVDVQDDLGNHCDALVTKITYKSNKGIVSSNTKVDCKTNICSANGRTLRQWSCNDAGETAIRTNIRCSSRCIVSTDPTLSDRCDNAPPVVPVTRTCSDDDGGQVFTTAGKVTSVIAGNSDIALDRCFSQGGDNFLTEYECNTDNTIKSTAIKCDGACVETDVSIGALPMKMGSCTPMTATCSKENGITTAVNELGAATSFTDKCLDSRRLARSYSCSDSTTIALTDTTCTATQKCAIDSDGEASCIDQPVFCEDTEDTVNSVKLRDQSFVAGTTKVYDEEGNLFGQSTDYCYKIDVSGAEYVIEHFCRRNKDIIVPRSTTMSQIYSSAVRCRNGCSNGACLAPADSGASLAS
ncbi:hypothetical protein HYW76_00460 [Candidatus Pacearchaeota archaeon]|nr:hypothetical protein [Candidatus Pacearchaeota archaeon]